MAPYQLAFFSSRDARTHLQSKHACTAKEHTNESYKKILSLPYLPTYLYPYLHHITAAPLMGTRGR